MSQIRRFDHVGITVADLDAVTAFFCRAGLEVERRTLVEGEFVDTVIGIPGSRSQIVMLRAPGGGRAQDGGWGAYLPDLPGVVALGAGREQAAERIKEALSAYTEDLHERGESLPAPHHATGTVAA
jgi:predicted RNase H-like HicB family nuclease